MNGIIMRVKMHFCLRKLEKLWLDNNDTIAGEAAIKFSDTKSKLKVLKALQAAPISFVPTTATAHMPSVQGKIRPYTPWSVLSSG